MYTIYKLLVLLLLLCIHPILCTINNTCDVCNCDRSRVNCFRAGLDSVPINIPNTTTYLDLGENAFMDINQTAFNGLINLKKLLLDANLLSYLPEELFNPLTQLTYLDISDNTQITNISVTLFLRLFNLSILDLRENNLIAIPVGVFSNLNLLELHLEGNQLQVIDALYPRFLSDNTKIFIANNPLVCCMNDFWTPSGINLSMIQDEPYCTEEITNRDILNVKELGLPPPPVVTFRPAANNTVEVFWNQSYQIETLIRSEIIYSSSATNTIHNISSMAAAYNITELDLYSTYKLVVRTLHNASSGYITSPANCPITFILSDYAPSNITLQVVSTTSVLAYWSIPAIVNTNITGMLQGYILQLTDNEGFGMDIRTNVSSADTQYEFNGLEEYASYSIYISALSTKGEGPAAVTMNRTLPSIPSQAPQNFSATQGAVASDIYLQWNPPDKINQNGIISEYRIYYFINGSMNITTKSVSGSDTNVTISELESFSTYIFIMTAVNMVGAGPNASDSISTGETPPGQPQNLMAMPLATSITVTWHEPAITNGEIKNYTLTLRNDSSIIREKTVKSNVTSYTFTGLMEYTNYSIFVSGTTSGGQGVPATLVSETLPTSPSGSVTNLEPAAITSTSVELQWRSINPADLNGIFMQYEINYSDGDQLQNTVYTNEERITIDNLQPALQYAFSIRIENNIGFGPNSSTLYVNTSEDRPGSAPQNVMLSRYEEFNGFIVEWLLPEITNGIITSCLLTITPLYLYNFISEDLEPINITDVYQPALSHIYMKSGYNNYTVNVNCGTRIGYSSYSTERFIVLATRAAGFGPASLQVESVNSTALNVTWRLNSDNIVYGIVILFEVRLDLLQWDKVVVEQDTINYSYIVTGLEEYMNYTIYVRSNTSAGSDSEISTIGETQQGIPDVANAEMRLTWDRPDIMNFSISIPTIDQNGIILNYTIKYRLINSSDEVISLVYAPNGVDQSLTGTLSNLMNGSLYETQYSANTSVGESVYSNIVNFTTLPAYVFCPLHFESVYMDTNNRDQILSDPCYNKTGICYDNNTNEENFSCACLNGKTGEYCEDNINYCENEPCQNGGMCINMATNFECICTEFYTGSTCETDIDECENINICGNGECINLVPDYYCDCEDGYARDINGPNECSITCESIDCSFNGECMHNILTNVVNQTDISANKICTCNSGFTGDNCEASIDMCNPNPCNLINSKRCINFRTSFECVCKDDFFGVICSIPVPLDRCAAEPLNGLNWPNTPIGETAIIQCADRSQDLEGTIERICMLGSDGNGIFGLPFENCIRAAFQDFLNDLEMIDPNNITIDQSNMLIEQLLNLTNDVIASELNSLFPRELQIVRNGIDLSIAGTVGTNVTNDQLRNFSNPALNTISNLLSENNMNSYLQLDTRNGTGYRGQTAFSINFLVENITLGLANRMSNATENEVINNTNFNVLILNSAENNVTFGQTSASLDMSQYYQIQIGIQYNTLANLLNFQGNDSTINSSIINIIISMEGTQQTATTATTLDSPLSLSFSIPTIDINSLAQCVFWNTDTNQFSSEGLSVITTENNTIICQSQHATSFAILFAFKPQPKSDDERLAQRIVTYFLLTLSALAISAAIIIYIIMGKKFLKKRITIVHLNFCIAYLTAICLFIIQVGFYHANEIVCQIYAILIHYFFLAVFSWSLCEGILIYLKFFRIFSQYKITELVLVIILGWTLPLPIVIITVAARYYDYGRIPLEEACFLKGEPYYTNLALVVPAILLLLVNCGFLFLALFSFWKVSKNKKNKDKYKLLIIGGLVLLPVLGLPWIIGIFSSVHIFFEWIFILINAPQGVYFFIIQIMRNAEVKKKFSEMCCKNVRRQIAKSSTSGRVGLISAASSHSEFNSDTLNKGGAAERYKKRPVQRTQSENRGQISPNRSNTYDSRTVPRSHKFKKPPSKELSKNETFEMSPILENPVNFPIAASPVKLSYTVFKYGSKTAPGSPTFDTHIKPKKSRSFDNLFTSLDDDCKLNKSAMLELHANDYTKKEDDDEDGVFFLDVLFDDTPETRQSIFVSDIADVCLEAEIPAEPKVNTSAITVVSEINSGRFSKLNKVILQHSNGKKYMVAVRSANKGISELEQEELTSMMTILHDLGSHKNIISLISIVNDEVTLSTFFILDFACYGTLHEYIVASHDQFTQKYHKLVQKYGLISIEFKESCVKQLIFALEYLESKTIIHGDVAARNILITRNRTIKLNKIGVKLHPNNPPIYYPPKSDCDCQPMPVRWMAPECVVQGVKNSKNDAWAFGITCWEIYSNGDIPFKEQTDKSIVFEVNHLKLTKKGIAMDFICDIMDQCWKINPNHRPTFEQLNEFNRRRNLSVFSSGRKKSFNLKSISVTSNY